MKREDLIADLIAEATDILEDLELELVALERELGEGTDPGPRLQEVYRKFHTLKGTAGFFNLPHIVALSHEVENLLTTLSQKKVITTIILRELLASRDLLLVMIKGVADSGSDADWAADAAQMIERVRQLEEPAAAPTKTEQKFGLFTSAPASVAVESAEAAAKLQMSAGAVAKSEESPEEKPETLALAEAKPSAPIKTGSTPATEAGSGQAPRSSIRIAMEKVDWIMDTVGELVITESIIGSLTAAENPDQAELRKRSQELNRTVRNLQMAALSMRMIPVEGILQKLERQVLDLSRQEGKHVRFEYSGEMTEIDRGIVETLVDPLVHIVRNSIGHGLEDEATRIAAGKPAQGLLRVDVFNSGTDVHMSIMDDGRGCARHGR